MLEYVNEMSNSGDICYRFDDINPRQEECTSKKESKREQKFKLKEKCRRISLIAAEILYSRKFDILANSILFWSKTILHGNRVNLRNSHNRKNKPSFSKTQTKLWRAKANCQVNKRLPAFLFSCVYRFVCFHACLFSSSWYCFN